MVVTWKAFKNNNMLNIHFWKSIFERDYVNQYDLLLDTLVVKILPIFSNIEAEAQEVAEKEWERVNQSF